LPPFHPAPRLDLAVDVNYSLYRSFFLFRHGTLFDIRKIDQNVQPGRFTAPAQDILVLIFSQTINCAYGLEMSMILYFNTPDGVFTSAI